MKIEVQDLKNRQRIEAKSQYYADRIQGIAAGKPIASNAKVILLRDVGGLKKGESIDVYVPANSNPSVITYYNPKEEGKRYRLIVNTDIEPPVFKDEEKNAEGEGKIKDLKKKNNINFVYIIGAIALGLLIFRKK